MASALSDATIVNRTLSNLLSAESPSSTNQRLARTIAGDDYYVHRVVLFKLFYHKVFFIERNNAVL